MSSLFSIQKGPSFGQSTDVSINRPKCEVSIRYTQNGHQKSDMEELQLPPDLANGMLLNVIKNIRSDGTKTNISYLLASPKPRIVKLAITAEGHETFFIAGLRHEATRFVIKIELGGITGIIAPLIGKKPADTDVWVIEEGAPAFVRSEGPLFFGGPILET